MVILLLAILALVSCSPANNFNSVNLVNDSATIVNGKPVLATDLYARHTVAIAPENSTPCTGVIIAPHFILSAAHCADYFSKGHIFFGLVAKTGLATVYKVKNVTSHPKYCSTCFFADTEPADFKDYAIVEFAEELPVGFKPVELATFKQIKKGSKVHLAGYGFDENFKYDGILKATRAPVTAVGQFEFVTDETKNGTCRGDSGGPAFILEDSKIYLAGITSRGDALCNTYGIYGIPAAEIDWINSVIKR